jgi:hypothetical protein
MKIKAPPEDQNKDGFVDDGVKLYKKKLDNIVFPTKKKR